MHNFLFQLLDINSFLFYLKEKMGDWVKVLPIGESSQGRPIYVIKLIQSNSSTSAWQNRLDGSNKKAILIDAGVSVN